MDTSRKVSLRSQALVPSCDIKQETAALKSKIEALALENARLEKENMLMQHDQLCQQNMFLRMHSQDITPPGILAGPMMSNQHWRAPMNAWPMSPQVDYAPTCNIKQLSESKMKPSLHKAKGSRKKQDSDDGDSVASSIDTEPTSAGLSSYAATISGDDDVAVDEPNCALAEKELAQNAHKRLLTTVLMKNIPNNMTRDMLLDLIRAEGFEGSYDFVYLPLDFKGMVGVGYSFINLINWQEAVRFQQHFTGFSRWSFNSDKVCEVIWSKSLQGRDAHVERYRNSPVMHESMADGCRPVLYKDGERIPFPKPTKRIRAPRQWPTRGVRQ